MLRILRCASDLRPTASRATTTSRGRARSAKSASPSSKGGRGTGGSVQRGERSLRFRHEVMRLDESTQVDLSQMRTFADIARFHARERPEAVALSFAGRQTTFSRFEERTNQVANALLRDGVRRGERISYLGKNSDVYFELLFGAAKVGVVMAPISWRLEGPEVRHVLNHAATRILFLEGGAASLAEAA